MSAPLARPLPNTYWLLPGRLLAGEYPGGIDADAAGARLERLLAAGVDCFVNLTMQDELPPYEVLLPPGVQHFRLPIPDHGVPAEPAQMVEILELLERSLRSGRCIYLHCRAGIGRTGTVAACLLVERGLAAEAALESLNHAWQQCERAQAWPSVPETDAQIDYVRSWRPRAAPHTAAAAAATESVAASGLSGRFRGALVGLAVGDALAAATEQRKPGTFEPVAQLLGGGPHQLPPGAWSDDTAMALALADSLTACGSFDPRDQVERYRRWQEEGYMSATGRCVGITASTVRALAAARWRRQLFPGSHEPGRLDPEPLARVAPPVMFAFADARAAVRLATDAARLTCQAATVLEACGAFAAMLHAALAGRAKEEVLAPERALAELGRHGPRSRLRAVLSGGYRRKQAAQLRAGPGIVEALEAALWAFDSTSDFRTGALAAANLGGRSDVITAAYGQLAGAFYGAASVPAPWRSVVARRELLEVLADRLFGLGAAGTAAPRVE
ncbi:MAG TPA: ADP-ribosylglycohydrolase family protein [Steroidobacteraceae bacterium]|nr:ADP-ribosylglycohydrolase family protein [Steroidobacteraceae bacterium]